MIFFKKLIDMVENRREFARFFNFSSVGAKIQAIVADSHFQSH